MGRIGGNTRLNAAAAALRQMFPDEHAPDETNLDVARLTNAYHKYKNEYVQHLSFAPEDENLSRV